jgi:hypothetical protein
MAKKERVVMPRRWLAMPKRQQPNGTPGKKPPTPD